MEGPPTPSNIPVLSVWSDSTSPTSPGTLGTSSRKSSVTPPDLRIFPSFGQLYFLESKSHSPALGRTAKDSYLPGQNANSVQSGIMFFGSSGFSPPAVLPLPSLVQYTGYMIKNFGRGLHTLLYFDCHHPSRHISIFPFCRTGN